MAESTIAYPSTPGGASLLEDGSGRKLYFPDGDGGFVFRSERKVGDVRVPNYVYDLWLPVIGIEAVGLYALYCRLERHGQVSGMTRDALCRALRIGTHTLPKLNEKLEACGFIRIIRAEGQARLEHRPTGVIILDPAKHVSEALVERFCPHGMVPLTPWLVGDTAEAPAVPCSTAGGFNQHGVAVPPSTATYCIPYCNPESCSEDAPTHPADEGTGGWIGGPTPSVTAPEPTAPGSTPDIRGAGNVCVPPRSGGPPTLPPKPHTTQVANPKPQASKGLPVVIPGVQPVSEEWERKRAIDAALYVYCDQMGKLPWINQVNATVEQWLADKRPFRVEMLKEAGKRGRAAWKARNVGRVPRFIDPFMEALSELMIEEAQENDRRAAREAEAALIARHHANAAASGARS